MKTLQLINKMPCQKIEELYYSCNLISNADTYIVYCMHMNVVNHVWPFGELQFSYMWQLLIISVNVTLN
jgi:hypothetical protein